MECTNNSDISKFIIDIVNINHRPIKFRELNTATTLNLLQKGYNVIVKEDKKTLSSNFYSVVLPLHKIY